MYKLTIPGRPVPKGRPRCKGNYAYTDRRTREYENRIKQICKEHFDEPLTGDVVLEVYFYLCGRRVGDCDNYLKAIMDGLQPYAVKDDKQIYRIVTERREVLERNQQRAEVRIRPKGE